MNKFSNFKIHRCIYSHSLLKKYIKSTLIIGVISTSKAKANGESRTDSHV